MIDTTEAVRLAAEALSQHRLAYTEDGLAACQGCAWTDVLDAEWEGHAACIAVTAALPALAEQFAALIEAAIRANPLTTQERWQQSGLIAAARLVREAAEVTPLRPTVLGEVAAERSAQNAKWGEQNHPDGHGRNLYPWYPSASGARARCDQYAAEGSVTWADIFAEEVCEANEEGDDPTRLRAELIQVAAVAVAWVECIDRREAAEVTG